jgi:hypothetical protein
MHATEGQCIDHLHKQHACFEWEGPRFIKSSLGGRRSYSSDYDDDRDSFGSLGAEGVINWL